MTVSFFLSCWSLSQDLGRTSVHCALCLDVTLSLRVGPCATDTPVFSVLGLHMNSCCIAPCYWTVCTVVLYSPHPGPLLGSPVQDVAMTLHSLMIHPGTSTTMVTACISRCMQKALKKADKQVLEPLMSLEVTVSREYLSPVLADLAQRRGNIQEIQTRQDNRVVLGFVPLAEIMVSLHLTCTRCLL